MEFALLGLILLFVPFVLPIVSWLTGRRTRERVEALELALEEQSRAFDLLKVQLAQLRRDVRTVPSEVAAPDRRTEPAAATPAEPIVVPTESVPPTPVQNPVETTSRLMAKVPAAPVPPPSAVPPTPLPSRPVRPMSSEAPKAPTISSPPTPLAARVETPPGARQVPPPRDGAPPPSQPPPAAGFDWEGLVGVKLFSAIAGVALVLAAVFFLRYSIEHGWLQPPIRVAIGIVVALGLLVACELKAARQYPATANALDAAAIAILFATFFAAHARWDLIPGWLAFVLLGGVTAVAVLLSIRRESLFIAVLGLLGGFATPLLLSTGENRPIPLFTYLLLLNVGLAWVAYRNRWPVLTALTLVFTTVYQWGWVLRFLSESDLPLAMGIFLVFPLVTFAGVWLARRPPAGDGSSADDQAFELTAVLSAIVPLAFGIFLSAVPAYGAHASMLFGFLLLVDGGLLVVAVARRQMLLFGASALTTVVVFAVWLSASYASEARTVALIFTSIFVVLFLIAEDVVARFGRTIDEEGRVARYAAPTLLFVFPALVRIEPAFSAAWPPFATLAALLLACAARAIAARDGYLYYIAAFFAVMAQAVWSVAYLSEDTLAFGLRLYAAFGVIAIAAPLIARGLHRPLEPAGGAGAVLLTTLALLLYLSTGPVSAAALWGLALLLAILNAGLFVESAAARLPVVSLVGGVLSWAILAVWWLRAAGSVGVLPSLSVLIALTLLTLAGHAWAHRATQPAAEPVSRSAGGSLFAGGLFLGLVGHLFLLFLALNPEWSLPPWPLFGALTVITLATSAASLYSRTPVLHTVGIAASAFIITTWATAASASPWPSVALVASAVAAAYALLWVRLWRVHRAGAIAAFGAAAALFMGEITAMAAAVASEPPSIWVLIAAHTGNLSILLALTWVNRWRHVALVVAAMTWMVVLGWRGEWRHLLLLAGALYAVVTAYPFAIGSRVGRDRDPYLAAVIASAMFFFTAREALQTGGFEWMVGVVPVGEAVVFAVLLRQLLRLEHPGERDPGRLALVAGAALAFVTVAIPVQLQHQWITIGWALEAAALAWLFTRVPHRGLLYCSLALLAAVFARLTLNPEIFGYEPRGELRILNWYLYTYGIVAAAFFAAAWWLSRSGEEAIGGYRPSRVLPGAAVILLFLLLNIEIADFYATGPEIMFRFGAGVSQDLTYTIGWLLFGMLLLAAGIYAQSRPARIAAVTLIAVTAFKCFLYDLGSLGGLYRVGSFVGLGIALALVSLALQKFVLTKPREAQ